MKEEKKGFFPILMLSTTIYKEKSRKRVIYKCKIKKYVI